MAGRICSASRSSWPGTLTLTSEPWATLKPASASACSCSIVLLAFSPLRPRSKRVWGAAPQFARLLLPRPADQDRRVRAGEHLGRVEGAGELVVVAREGALVP